jgi:hypothetical protein
MSATLPAEQANVSQPEKGQNEMSFESDRGPLFVVGMWRSGTSLLYRLINQHPQICLMYEGDLAVLGPLFMWGSPRSKWTEYWDFWSGALRRHAIDPASISPDLKDLRTSIRRIYRDYAGSAIWGCKSPNYYDGLQDLHRMFPDARFVIIWRDPADVCRSVLRAGQISYSWFNRRGMFHRALLGHRVLKKECDALVRRGAHLHQIQYEDLIKDPAITMMGICEFLNLPFEPKMASLKGSDHSAIDPAGQHKKVKSDRILVEDEAAEILTDAQKHKVAAYVHLWQEKYDGWPRVRNGTSLAEGKPAPLVRLADWTIYRSLRTLDEVRKWIYCLAPLWLLNAYRVAAGKPALLLRQKTSSEEKPKTSSAAL